MAKSLLRKLVRNFSENGPKLLLENGANLRDVLTILRDRHVHAIDFAAMTVERTHFVKPDYAHVAVDLLLKAPFRVAGAGPSQTILIYLLVEHQSTPERFFILRLADYLLQAYKMQKRAWEREHGSDAGLVLQPVPPIVLYTGERNLEKALVYHARSEAEHPKLRDVVDRSIQTDPHRQEYTKMGRTIAEMYIDQGREKGRVEGKQEEALDRSRMILLRLLRKRFKKLPRKMEKRVADAANLHELNAWLDNVIDAATLADVGIPVD